MPKKNSFLPNFLFFIYQDRLAHIFKLNFLNQFKHSNQVIRLIFKTEPSVATFSIVNQVQEKRIQFLFAPNFCCVFFFTTNNFKHVDLYGKKNLHLTIIQITDKRKIGFNRLTSIWNFLHSIVCEYSTFLLD